jgi:hypothetical protein
MAPVPPAHHTHASTTACIAVCTEGCGLYPDRWHSDPGQETCCLPETLNGDQTTPISGAPYAQGVLVCCQQSTGDMPGTSCGAGHQRPQQSVHVGGCCCSDCPPSYGKRGCERRPSPLITDQSRLLCGRPSVGQGQNYVRPISSAQLSQSGHAGTNSRLVVMSMMISPCH